MALSLQFFTLVAGLFFLSFSAEILLDRALRISRIFGLSDLAIGFLVMAVSTSLPELSVALASGIANAPAVMAGNVFGSNIADIFLILGVTFLLGSKLEMHRDSTAVLFKAVVGAALFSLFLLFAGISRLVGVLALVLFGVFVYYLLKQRAKVNLDGEQVGKSNAVVDSAVFLLSLVALLLSAHFVVSSASAFAISAGVSAAFVAATLVAWGTTLPEMMVNLVAVKRQRINIALGNIAGTVVSNLTLALGASALFYRTSISMWPFAPLVLFSLLGLICLALIFKFRTTLSKLHGVAFLLLYAAFLIISYLYD